MKYKPSINAKKIWRIRCTIVAFLLSILTGGIFVISVPIGTIFAAVWLTVYFFVIIIYIPLEYKTYQFDVNNEFITVKKGILFNKYIVVNVGRVLYIELFQSPLQRKMKVYSLIIHTAGSLVFIAQIEPDDAFHIRSVIKNSKETNADEASQEQASQQL